MSCAISTVSSGPTISRTVSGFGNQSAGKRLSFVRRSVVRRNASIFTSSRVASSSYLASADAHTSHLPCGISTVPRTSVVSVTLFIFHSYYGMLRPDQLAVVIAFSLDDLFLDLGLGQLALCQVLHAELSGDRSLRFAVWAVAGRTLFGEHFLSVSGHAEREVAEHQSNSQDDAVDFHLGQNSPFAPSK